MHNGTVKIWDSLKGYGFIITADQEELFVHNSDLHPAIKGKRLFEGQLVKFDIRRDLKGDRAVNVRLIK
jgi:CspA family cold shock protein